MRGCLHIFSSFINFVVMDTKTLTNILSERLDRDAEDITVLIRSLTDMIAEQVKQGDMVTMPGFGSFEPKMRAERIANHPSSGKKLLVPPKLSIVFKPSALLKQKVKN